MSASVPSSLRTSPFSLATERTSQPGTLRSTS